MNVASFGVQIDPTQALKATEELKQALTSIGAKAQTTQQQVTEGQQKFDAAVRASAQEAKSAATTVQGANQQVAASEQQVGAATVAAQGRAAEAHSRFAQSVRTSAAAATATASTHRTATDAIVRDHQRIDAAARQAGGGVGGAFRGMASHVGNFLANLANFIPGGVGLFAGLAQASTQAATGIARAGLAAQATSRSMALMVAATIAATGAMLALAVALGGGLALVIFGDRMTQAQAKLRAATKDTEVAAAVYERLYATSLETGVSIDEAAGSFVRFSIAARAIGATQEQVLQLVQTIQRAGIVSGSTTAEVSSAAMQLAQALASGRFQGDELRSVLENMPLLGEGIAKSLGVGVGQLRKMGEEGKLTAQVIFPAILKAGEDINKQFSEIPPSLGRGLAGIGNILQRAIADMDRELGSSKGVAAWLQQAKTAIEEARLLMVGLMAQGALQEAFWLKFRIEGQNALKEMLMFAPKLIASIIAGAPDVVQSMTSKNGLGGGLTDIMGGAIKAMGDELLWQFERAGAVITAAGDVVGATVSNAIERAKEAITFGASKANLINVTYDESYQGRVQGAWERHWARMQQNVGQVQSGIKQIGLNWQDLEKLFAGGTSDKKRLDELIAKLKTAEENAEKTSLAVKASQSVPPIDPAVERKFKTDADAVRDYLEQAKQMKALLDSGRASPQEAARFDTRSLDELYKNALDPAQIDQKLGHVRASWRAMEEERARLSEDANMRIAAGAGTVGDAFSTAASRIIDRWGNAMQMMSQGVESIVMSVSGNLAGALTDVVTGTKDAKTAFADMAVAVLKDIARIIIQMLVQLAIQTALRAMGFNYGGMAAPAATTAAPAIAMASGGPIHGGKGGVDDIPAWLTAGEYVIPKDAVDFYGQDHMDRLRSKRARRFAEGGLVGSGPAGSAPRGEQAGPISITINVDAKTSKVVTESKGSPEREKQRGEELARSIESATMQIIARERRPGGLLSR